MVGTVGMAASGRRKGVLLGTVENGLENTWESERKTWKIAEVGKGINDGYCRNNCITSRVVGNE